MAFNESKEKIRVWFKLTTVVAATGQRDRYRSSYVSMRSIFYISGGKAFTYTHTNIYKCSLKQDVPQAFQNHLSVKLIIISITLLSGGTVYLITSWGRARWKVYLCHIIAWTSTNNSFLSGFHSTNLCHKFITLQKKIKLRTRTEENIYMCVFFSVLTHIYLNINERKLLKARFSSSPWLLGSGGSPPRRPPARPPAPRRRPRLPSGAAWQPGGTLLFLLLHLLLFLLLLVLLLLFVSHFNQKVLHRHHKAKAFNVEGATNCSRHHLRDARLSSGVSHTSTKTQRSM